MLLNTKVFLILQVISPSPVPKWVQENGGLPSTHAACPTLGWLWEVGASDWDAVPPNANYVTMGSKLLNAGD